MLGLPKKDPSEDDWVGEPPEGRHTRDQADPDHWRRPARIAMGITIALGVVIILITVAGVISTL